MGVNLSFWQGVDINTGDVITLYDFPLRVTVGPPGAEIFELPAESIDHMAVATSSYLGTAAVLYLTDDSSDDFMVIEAVAREHLHTGTYHAALRAAHDDIELEASFERAWTDESDRADRLVREARRRHPFSA